VNIDVAGEFFIVPDNKSIDAMKWTNCEVSPFQAAALLVRCALRLLRGISVSIPTSCVNQNPDRVRSSSSRIFFSEVSDAHYIRCTCNLFVFSY